MSSKIKVLFVCVENSFRSQMSQAIANHFFSDYIIANSAGSNPSGKVHPNAITVLKELDIDTSGLYSKGFDDLKEKEYDYIITMGCKDVCPFYPSKASIEWELPDIKNEGLDKIRKLRDEIKQRIGNLVSKHFNTKIKY